MKNSKVILLICGAVLIAALAGFGWYRSAHVFVEGTAYPKNAEEITLEQGVEPAYVAALQAQLPDCVIHWQVPFQNGYVPNDTQTLTVTALEEADLAMAAYLPQLKTVDGSDCQAAPLLVKLQREHPELDVRYTVMVGDVKVSSDQETLSLEQPETAVLLEALPNLPRLKNLHLTEPVGDGEDLRQLQQACPDMTITWDKTVFGQTYENTVTELDLSSLGLGDVQEMETAMAWFPALQKVYFGEVPVDNDTMADYRQRQAENYKVVWDVRLNYYISIRSDAEYFMPIKFYHTVVDRDLENLKYFNDMITLDVGHMPITHCEWLRNMPKLQYLILADTEVSDLSPVSTLKELIFFEVFDTPVRDYTPLLECTKLQDLNICWTSADPAVMAQMTWLKNLWWWGNMDHDLTEEEKTMVTQSLSDARVVFVTQSSTGGGWRKLDNYYKMRDNLGMPYFSQLNPDDPTQPVTGG